MKRIKEASDCDEWHTHMHTLAHLHTMAIKHPVNPTRSLCHHGLERATAPATCAEMPRSACPSQYNCHKAVGCRRRQHTCNQQPTWCTCMPLDSRGGIHIIPCMYKAAAQICQHRVDIVQHMAATTCCCHLQHQVALSASGRLPTQAAPRDHNSCQPGHRTRHNVLGPLSALFLEPLSA